MSRYDWLFACALVGYRPTRKDRVLRHPMRKRLVEVLQREPGISLADLRRRLGCSWGTVYHHARLLEKHDLVQWEEHNRRQRLFSTDIEDDQRRRLLFLSRGKTLDLAMAILSSPGIVQRDLTDQLALSRKMLRTYMNDLVREGLVLERSEGRFKCYHATPALVDSVTHLQHVGGPEDGPQMHAVDSWTEGIEDVRADARFAPRRP
ncbi:MAG: winged helix-turn-helix transcriptional regulator [Thermoplasmatota archaeon]